MRTGFMLMIAAAAFAFPASAKDDVKPQQDVSQPPPQIGVPPFSTAQCANKPWRCSKPPECPPGSGNPCLNSGTVDTVMKANAATDENVTEGDRAKASAQDALP